MDIRSIKGAIKDDLGTDKAKLVDATTGFVGRFGFCGVPIAIAGQMMMSSGLYETFSAKSSFGDRVGGVAKVVVGGVLGVTGFGFCMNAGKKLEADLNCK